MIILSGHRIHDKLSHSKNKRTGNDRKKLVKLGSLFAPEKSSKCEGKQNMFENMDGFCLRFHNYFWFSFNIHEVQNKAYADIDHSTTDYLDSRDVDTKLIKESIP